MENIRRMNSPPKGCMPPMDETAVLNALRQFVVLEKE